jgi:glycosyltransferase involved in cell wall biosynthesis
MANFPSLTAVFCVEDFPPRLAGGGGRSNAVLASLLADHFGRLIVFHSSASGLNTYLVSNAGFVPRERETIALDRIDIIQVCGRVDPTLVLELRGESKAPVIYTSRSNANTLDRLGTRPIALDRNRKQDRLLEIAVAIIACSETAADELKSDYPQYATKIMAIHNALDPRLVETCAAYDFDLTSAKTAAFGFAGRLRLHKGLLDLLSACESLWANESIFDLKILGGHPHRGEMHLEVALANACEHWPHYLQMYDWSDDPKTVAAFYKSVHCVVVPSYVEPFGLVAIEALSAGCFVITSDAGGLKETMSTESCALMYPKGDTAALEKHMAEFISARLWSKMNTSACAASVRRRFSTDRMLAKYLELYASVI